MATMKRIGSHKTSITTRDGWHVVTYHKTDVVSWSDTLVRLDSGGWLTPTTKTRMNQAANQFGLNFRVYQERGSWFVNIKGKTLPFIDGMTFNHKESESIYQVTI